MKDWVSTTGLQPARATGRCRWTRSVRGGAVTCGITFTFGGLHIDVDGQVLAKDGSPVAGLFAGGEIAGGPFHGNDPGGSGLMAGAVFGRRAGVAAAAASRTTLAAG